MKHIKSFLKNIWIQMKLFFAPDSFKWDIMRCFDFEKAEEFYQKNKEHLKEMCLCMGFDKEICEDVIYNGELICTPICYNNVAGVIETAIDIPCIYFRFKSGYSGKMACFQFYEFNKDLNTKKYPAEFGIPYKPKCFKVFNPDDYPYEAAFYQKIQELAKK